MARHENTRSHGVVNSPNYGIGSVYDDRANIANLFRRVTWEGTAHILRDRELAIPNRRCYDEQSAELLYCVETKPDIDSQDVLAPASLPTDTTSRCRTVWSNPLYGVPNTIEDWRLQESASNEWSRQGRAQDLPLRSLSSVSFSEVEEMYKCYIDRVASWYPIDVKEEHNELVGRLLEICCSRAGMHTHGQRNLNHMDDLASNATELLKLAIGGSYHTEMCEKLSMENRYQQLGQPTLNRHSLVEELQKEAYRILEVCANSRDPNSANLDPTGIMNDILATILKVRMQQLE